MLSHRLRFYIETIGIVAVVASLIAVVFELRQTQSALVASTYQARAFDAISRLQYVADTEYLLPLIVATNDGQNIDAIRNLSATDKARMFQYLALQQIDLDNEFYQFQNGFLEREFLEGLTIPFIKQWAPSWRALGIRENRPSFTVFVDGVLEEEMASLD